MRQGFYKLWGVRLRTLGLRGEDLGITVGSSDSSA